VSGSGVLVVGSINADLVVRVPRHARPGETVLGGDMVVHPGGKGANQAVAAARLGGTVAMAGRVGSDGYGAMLVDTLRREGVDVNAVRVVAGSSGIALITVDDEGENAITVAPGANARLGVPEVAALAPAIAAATVVSLQLEIPLPAVWAVIAAAEAAATRVVLNLSPIPPDPLPPGAALRVCDPLVLNEHEAGVATGATDPRAALDALRSARSRPRSIVLTLGGGGALIAQGDADPVAVRAPRVDAVDTTGAGDAFTGALAWRLAEGDDLAEATRWAVRAGAAAVRRPGAQPSYPTVAELP